MSKKLRELVGVSEAVGHGDRELVCVSERDTLAVWEPQGEKPRSCRDNQF